MATTTNFYSSEGIDLSLTCVPDIDALILLKLSIHDLNNVSTTNKYLNSISKGEYLWKRKVVIDFGPDYPSYKPKNETFMEQYKYLFNIDKSKLLDEAYEQGRMDAIYYMKDHGVQPTPHQAGIAASHGHIKVLKLLERWGILPNPHVGAEGAAQNGHTEVLKLLKSWDILPNRYTVESAAKGGHVEVFKLFKSWTSDDLRLLHPNELQESNEPIEPIEPIEPKEITQDILFTETVANLAAWYGHVEVLKLLKSWDILPSKNAADCAAGFGYAEVIKLLKSWACDDQRSSQSGDLSKLNGHNETTKGIFITRHGTNYAARNGHVEVLKLLKSWDILPSKDAADYAAGGGHVEVLKLLKSWNILPTPFTANRAASNGHIEALKLIKSWGVLPTGSGIYFEEYHAEVEELLESWGIYSKY